MTRSYAYQHRAVRVVRWIDSREGMFSARQLADGTGIAVFTAYRWLRALEESGDLVCERLELEDKRGPREMAWRRVA
jgi:transposase